MAEAKLIICDLCGKAHDSRDIHYGLRTYRFHVGEEQDGADQRWCDIDQTVVLCRECQARLMKALHGKGKFHSQMYSGESLPSNWRPTIRTTERECDGRR